MNEDESKISLREIINADLIANCGRSGLFRCVARAVIDPGFGTVLGYRLIKAVSKGPFNLLGRLLWRLHIMSSGCHISLSADIGPGLHLPHPIGVCIGIGTKLGRSVTVYQNVTIGRHRNDERYPRVCDDAIISANSVIAGNVTVGMRAVVGAGSVVISDVPDDGIVMGNPAKRIWSNRPAAAAADGGNLPLPNKGNHIQG